jgi:hypothetical protein
MGVFDRRFNPTEAKVNLLWREATDKVIVWDEDGRATAASAAARLDYIRSHGKLVVISAENPNAYSKEALGWLQARMDESDYCILGDYFYFNERFQNTAFEFRLLFS